MPPRQLTREAESLRQRLLHVPGVKKVDILGERPERIFVEFSYARLATLGVSARAIFDALSARTSSRPRVRSIPTGRRCSSASTAPTTISRRSATRRSWRAAATLKLSDIAEVERGYEDPATFLIRHDGEPALVLGVVMQEGWNGLDLGKALDAEEKTIAADLPVGLTFTKITDQAVNITKPIDEFMLKFFVALASSWSSAWSASAGASASSWRPPCR